jgi:hypothetical protein
VIDGLIALLAIALLTLHAGPVAAQDALPAPVPEQSAAPPKPLPFPQGGVAPVTGLGAPLPASPRSEACASDFKLLREEAEKRGKLIKAASERKAPPDEACKLIAGFGDAEIKMIKYVEANAVKCAIPVQIADQLKAGHKNTEALQQKVCNVAQQIQQQRGPSGSIRINDRGDSSIALDLLGRPLVGDFGQWMRK